MAEGTSLIYSSHDFFNNMIPNDFKIVEPNQNCQVLIDQYMKSFKTPQQILAIFNMMGIPYNIALNNMLFYCWYGRIGKTVREYFDDYYNGKLLPNRYF